MQNQTPKTRWRGYWVEIRAGALGMFVHLKLVRACTKVKLRPLFSNELCTFALF